MSEQHCVYVLHFDDGTHYWGRTKDFEHRMAMHLAGTGARWVAYKQRMGIGFRSFIVAHYKTGAEAYRAERKLKHNGSRKRHCPVCRGEE